MESDLQTSFYLDQWLVQPRQNRIRGPEKTTRVEPKVMDVLVCLARHAGEVVTRDQLLETVWAGTVVTDDVLTRSISELRKAFGDDPRRPRVIETIPKAGYRLLTPLTAGYRGDNIPPSVPALELAPSVQPTAALGAARGRWARAVAGGAVLILAGTFLLTRHPAPPASYHPVPLTTYPGAEANPALSPDGRQVAFAWRGPDGANSDIYIKLVDSETPLRLTDDAALDHAPAWAPDGTQVAFMRRDGDGCAIWLVGALGGPARRLGACGSSLYGDLEWSPDGRWLAFNDRSGPDEAFGIYLLSPETLDRHRLTSPPADIWGDHDPAFSPDGTRLSFTRSQSEGMQDVYLVPVDGGEPTRLTDDSRNVYGHAFSPDGRAVLFSSNRAGRVELWRVPASGGAPSRVGLSDGQALFPSVSYRSGRLAYLQNASEINIWQVRIGEETSAAPLIASTQWDLHPQVSPDGRKVAFASNRSGSYEVWVSDRAGRGAVRLTDFGGTFTSTPRWSPDGQSLVFTARPEGQADLYVIGVEGAVPRRLTTEGSDEMAAGWSSDGQEVYFSSNRSGAWEVWKMPAAGGAAEQVTRRGGFGPQASPDGQFLYYAKHKEEGLWRMPVAGGSESRVLEALQPADWGSWAVHGGGVYFVRRGRPPVLAFHSFATGRTDTVFVPPGGLPAMDPALAVTPDGAWLLFGQVDRTEQDLMLVEGIR